jgi:tetratricopeptide (TPR) repeat protein
MNTNQNERYMIETNTTTSEFSFVARGREFLEKGDIASAVECYGKAFDPDSLDEREARSMLIEARSHLSRKHLLEALESFEEALLMGTDVQRRQALDGILTVGQIRSGLSILTDALKSRLDALFGGRPLSDFGLTLMGNDENVILISKDAAETLPVLLTKGSRISRLPQHLTDYDLPFETTKCIPYINQDDVNFILDVAAELMRRREPAQSE